VYAVTVLSIPLVDCITMVKYVMSSTVCTLSHFTLVKEALIEIGCVVTSLVRWLVVMRVHCGQTVQLRPIVTMEH